MNYSNLKKHECKGKYFLPCIEVNFLTNKVIPLVLTHSSDVEKFKDELFSYYENYIPFNITYKVFIKMQYKIRGYKIVSVYVYSLSAAMRLINEKLNEWRSYHDNK